MVSAPETNWMSRQVRPASSRASRAAATPYSTKLRPHLPQGCMPTPRTATGSGIGRCPALGRRQRLPLPDQVFVVVVLVEGVEDELGLVADGEVGGGDAPHHLTEHDHLLFGELHRRDAEGLVGIGGDVRRRRLVAGVGVGPDATPAAQGDLVELTAGAVGVPAESGFLGEGDGPAGLAAAAEQGWGIVEGEPAR